MISKFDKWAEWFKKTPGRQVQIPWQNDLPLEESLKKAIAKSIGMFQKGESSDGRRFLEKAMRATNHQQDQSYVEALRHFILEENRHSAMLAQFMESQNIPLIDHHWVDEIFRLVRKPGGLEQSLRVLLTAEIVSVPYYTALAQATDSPALKTICGQILADEFLHLRFQGEALGQTEAPHGRLQILLTRAVHRIFLEQTILVVWLAHRKVLKLGGYSFFRFRNDCVFIWFRVTEFSQAKNIDTPFDPFAAQFSDLMTVNVTEPSAAKSEKSLRRSKPAAL